MAEENVLPGTRAGDRALLAGLDGWLSGAAMRDLAAASGWSWPRTASIQDLAHQLAELSESWNFRGRAATQAKANFVERSSMPTDGGLVIDGTAVDPDRIVTAAAALGLVDAPSELDIDPTYAIVLSGAARANVNRAQFAADVLENAQVQPSAIIALTAHRELGAAERTSCADLGLTETDTEWTTMRDALVAAFDLGAPASVEESSPDEGRRSDRFGRHAVYRWAGHPVPAELVVVPSPSARSDRPRPANTGDQLRWWARAAARLTGTPSVLLVTTQIYVPYQQFVAVRVLRQVARGCRVRTIGVTQATGTVATRVFTPQDYLQETRSALLAAAALLDDLAANDG